MENRVVKAGIDTPPVLSLVSLMSRREFFLILLGIDETSISLLDVKWYPWPITKHRLAGLAR